MIGDYWLFETKAEGIKKEDFEKFKPGHNIFETEEGIKAIAPSNSLKDSELTNFIDNRIKLATSKEEKAAWMMRKIEREFTAFDGTVDANFFVEWIHFLFGNVRNRSRTYDIIKETGGWDIINEPPIHNKDWPDVKKYLESFYYSHQKYLEKLLRMKLFREEIKGLPDLFLFFKYIVKGSPADLPTGQFPALFTAYSNPLDPDYPNGAKFGGFFGEGMDPTRGPPDGAGKIVFGKDYDGTQKYMTDSYFRTVAGERLSPQELEAYQEREDDPEFLKIQTDTDGWKTQWNLAKAKGLGYGDLTKEELNEILAGNDQMGHEYDSLRYLIKEEEQWSERYLWRVKKRSMKINAFQRDFGLAGSEERTQQFWEAYGAFVGDFRNWDPSFFRDYKGDSVLFRVGALLADLNRAVEMEEQEAEEARAAAFREKWRKKNGPESQPPNRIAYMREQVSGFFSYLITGLGRAWNGLNAGTRTMNPTPPAPRPPAPEATPDPEATPEATPNPDDPTSSWASDAQIAAFYEEHPIANTNEEVDEILDANEPPRVDRVPVSEQTLNELLTEAPKAVDFHEEQDSWKQNAKQKQDLIVRKCSNALGYNLKANNNELPLNVENLFTPLVQARVLLNMVGGNKLEYEKVSTLLTKVKNGVWARSASAEKEFVEEFEKIGWNTSFAPGLTNKRTYNQLTHDQKLAFAYNDTNVIERILAVDAVLDTMQRGEAMMDSSIFVSLLSMFNFRTYYARTDELNNRIFAKLSLYTKVIPGHSSWDVGQLHSLTEAIKKKANEYHIKGSVNIFTEQNPHKTRSIQEFLQIEGIHHGESDQAGFGFATWLPSKPTWISEKRWKTLTGIGLFGSAGFFIPWDKLALGGNGSWEEDFMKKVATPLLSDTAHTQNPFWESVLKGVSTAGTATAATLRAGLAGLYEIWNFAGQHLDHGRQVDEMIASGSTQITTVAQMGDVFSAATAHTAAMASLTVERTGQMLHYLWQIETNSELRQAMALWPMSGYLPDASGGVWIPGLDSVVYNAMTGYAMETALDVFSRMVATGLWIGGVALTGYTIYTYRHAIMSFMVNDVPAYCKYMNEVRAAWMAQSVTVNRSNSDQIKLWEQWRKNQMGTFSTIKRQAGEKFLRGEEGQKWTAAFIRKQGKEDKFGFAENLDRLLKNSAFQSLDPKSKKGILNSTADFFGELLGPSGKAAINKIGFGEQLGSGQGNIILKTEGTLTQAFDAHLYKTSIGQSYFQYPTATLNNDITALRDPTGSVKTIEEYEQFIPLQREDRQAKDSGEQKTLDILTNLWGYFEDFKSDTMLNIVNETKIGQQDILKGPANSFKLTLNAYAASVRAVAVSNLNTIDGIVDGLKYLKLNGSAVDSRDAPEIMDALTYEHLMEVLLNEQMVDPGITMSKHEVWKLQTWSSPTGDHPIAITDDQRAIFQKGLAVLAQLKNPEDALDADPEVNHQARLRLHLTEVLSKFIIAKDAQTDGLNLMTELFNPAEFINTRKIFYRDADKDPVLSQFSALAAMSDITNFQYYLSPDELRRKGRGGDLARMALELTRLCQQMVPNLKGTDDYWATCFKKGLVHQMLNYTPSRPDRFTKWIPQLWATYVKRLHDRNTIKHMAAPGGLPPGSNRG